MSKELVKELTPEDNILSFEHESIAQAMLETRGDLSKASRMPSVAFNAMALRKEVASHPDIRVRYHQLLATELSEKGLHIAERILRIAELQERAFGGTEIITDEDGTDTEIHVPADPKMVIELSKEISRLIVEGKNQNISPKAAVLIATKEDAAEILAAFLTS